MRSALIRGDLGITAPTDALAKREQKDQLYRPGIEPGPSIWQTLIVPLNHRYFNRKWVKDMRYILKNSTISIADSPLTKVKYPNPARTSLVARFHYPTEGVKSDPTFIHIDVISLSRLKWIWPGQIPLSHTQLQLLSIVEALWVRHVSIVRISPATYLDLH